MLRLKKFLRVLEVKPWVVGLFLGVVYFVLYWLTASRVNVSYADSDLLTTIGYQLGVAHPPGYPLYIFLVYVFTHLPIWGSVAFKAHLLSMLLHSVSLVVVFLACVDLSSLVFEKTSKLTKIWVATLATAGLGSSALFWLYSSVAEKYPLNDLFIALIFLATVKIFSGQKEKLWLMVLAVVGGLALNHHHTIFLFLPAVFLSLVLFRKLIFKNLFWTTLVFVVSLVVPVIMLLGFNSRKTAISWRFEPNAKGLYRMISRRDLSGYMVLTGEYRGIYLDGLTVDDVLAKTPEVLGELCGPFWSGVFGCFWAGSGGTNENDEDEESGVRVAATCGDVYYGFYSTVCRVAQRFVNSRPSNSDVFGRIYGYAAGV